MTDAPKPKSTFWLTINELADLPKRMREAYLVLTNRQSEALERLGSIERLLKKMEKTMAKGQEKLTQEIEELRTAVDAYTTAAATRLETAIQEARDAWEQDNQQAFETAASQIDEIAGKLSATDPIEPGPGETPVEPFEPSGNTPASSKKKD